MSNGTQAEPWIEELIQNYGTQQRTARVLARVLRVLESHAVGEATGSLKELDEDPVALLLLSDGPAAIRGLLTREAWQKFLRGPHSLGAGETFSSLAGHSVLLLRYSLMAQREVEEGKWQLMLTVHELTTTFTPEDHKPSRSLQEGPSSDCEPCCSESPATACQDRLSSLLQEVRGLLPPPRGPDCQGCPLIARTRWDRDRIRHKDDGSFSIPVSCCHISERQMEVMQRQAASLCVSVICSSGELGEKGYPHSPDPENDSLLEFGNQEKVPINPWDRFAADIGIRTPSEEGSVNTVPFTSWWGQHFSLYKVSFSASLLVKVPSLGGAENRPEAHHSVFISRDSGSGSVSPEGLPEIDDSPLCSPQPHHSQPDMVAMVTSRQKSTWSNRPAPCEKQANEGLESAGGSEQLRGPSDQSSHPPAEPTSSSIESPPPHVWTRLLVNDVTLSLGLRPCRSSHWDHLRLHPRIRPPLPSPPIFELKTQQEEGILLGKSVSRSQRRKRPLLTADQDVGIREDEENLEGGGLHHDLMVVNPMRKKNSKFSLTRTPALQDQGLSGARLSPASSVHISQALRTHPGGTLFSYTYDPKGCVAQAPGHLRVRDDILRWTVRYLIHKVPYESTS